MTRQRPTQREIELTEELEARQARRDLAECHDIPERFLVDPLAADDDPDTAAWL